MKKRIGQGLALLLGISTLTTVVMLSVSLVSLARKPFAALWVERETESLILRIDRMIAAEVDQDWLDTRIEAALAEEPRDWSRMDLILEIAEKEEISPDPPLAARMESARKSDGAMLHRTKFCLRCAIDANDCPDLDTLKVCNFPLELTPVGDGIAILRNIQAWKAGDPVDDLEVGLAALGLVATVAVPVTGGSFVTVKAGTTALRVARRMGSLTKSFEAVLWKQVRALDFSRLHGTMSDLGRIHHATGSYAETIGFLRHIDVPADTSRLASLARAGGKRARAAVEVLGKSRALRATLRWSDEVLYAIKLIVATLVQVGLAALALLNRTLRYIILRHIGRGNGS